MATGLKQPISLYLSYAQKDEALKQEFEDYLAILQQTGLISGWVEHEVQSGTDWSQVVDPRLFSADLVLILVSPALLQAIVMALKYVKPSREVKQQKHESFQLSCIM